MAAQRSAPLHFWRRTMMGGFIYYKCFIRRKYNNVNMSIKMGFWFYIR